MRISSSLLVPAVLVALCAPTSAQNRMIDDLGLPRPEGIETPQKEMVPEHAPGIGSYTHTQAPTLAPYDFPGELDGLSTAPSSAGTPQLVVAEDEIGIVNSSASDLTFLVGDPPRKVTLKSNQIKVVPSGATQTITARIQTGTQGLTDFTLSAGDVYLIESKDGAWVFNRR